ncbi:ABC transporter permease [Demequina aestuarii]|uniref:ABC transporter permease n=1 Tax=Demequina aestuarii TaxID=327095 RepID=UPI000784F643|nr:FtsX-like permease family protein [Demequina aestuarii]
MKWLPVGLVGAAAAWMGWVSGPLFENWNDPGGYGLNFWVLPMGWLAIVFYAPFFFAVVGGPVLAFRSLWLSTQRAEIAARIALGHSRQTLIRGHVSDGVRDGLIAGLGGVTLGGALRQIMTGFVGVQFVSNTLWDYTAFVTLAVVCFALAYWVAAAWATRGSVRAVASGQIADAPAPRPARGARRPRRRIILATAVALAAAGLNLVVWAPDVLSTDDTDGDARVLLAIAAGILVNVGAGLALPGLLMYAGARSSVRATRALGAAVGGGAGPGTARSLAADAVARPTPMRTGAVAAVVVVMGVAVTATALSFDLEHANRIANDLDPHATVSTIELSASEPAQSVHSGWAAPLPPELLDDLRADSDLTVIEAGVLTTEPREHESWGDDGLPFMDASRDLLIAVDPAALDAVVQDSGKALYLTDGTVWQNGELGTIPSSGPGGLHIEVNGVRGDADAVNGPSPWTGISRPWAESLWGTAPTSAVMLYPAGEVTVDEALSAHDLDGLHASSANASFRWSSSTSPGLVTAVTAPFLAVAVAIVVGLAWSGQRLRARDQATLLALGATPSALRGAAALESFLVTAVAGAVGCLGGALLGPLAAAVAFSSPIRAAGPGLVLWNMGHTLTIMPWGVLLGLVVGAAVIAAGGAALIRVRLDRLSPAQQLSEAQKAGTP